MLGLIHEEGSSQLALEDCICPICLVILVEPVTLPCRHELCIQCFKRTVQCALFQCPFCRLRFSSWARQAARDNNLVNRNRWENIQKSFPAEVAKKMNDSMGYKEDEENDSSIGSACNITISAPGEVHKEYEDLMAKHESELRSAREDEVRANETFILNSIQEKDKKKEIEEFLSLEKRLPTPGHVSWGEGGTDMWEEGDNRCGSRAGSTSSLGSEVNFDNARRSLSRGGLLNGIRSPLSSSCRSHLHPIHDLDPHDHRTLCGKFTPIQAAPRTPPKRQPDGRVISPPLVQSIATRLRFDVTEPSTSDGRPGHHHDDDEGKGWKRARRVSPPPSGPSPDETQTSASTPPTETTTNPGASIEFFSIEEWKSYMRSKQKQEEADRDMAVHLQSEIDRHDDNNKIISVDRSSDSSHRYMLRSRTTPKSTRCGKKY